MYTCGTLIYLFTRLFAYLPNPYFDLAGPGWREYRWPASGQEPLPRGTSSHFPSSLSQRYSCCQACYRSYAHFMNFLDIWFIIYLITVIPTSAVGYLSGETNSFCGFWIPVISFVQITTSTRCTYTSTSGSRGAHSAAGDTPWAVPALRPWCMTSPSSLNFMTLFVIPTRTMTLSARKRMSECFCFWCAYAVLWSKSLKVISVRWKSVNFQILNTAEECCTC